MHVARELVLWISCLRLGEGAPGLVSGPIDVACLVQAIERSGGGENKKPLAGTEHASSDVIYSRAVTRKIAHLLELAYMCFDQKRFDRCITLCDQILLIDPGYTVAKEFKEDSEKTLEKEEYYEIQAKTIDQWKKLTDDDEKPAIPSLETVRLPSPEKWNTLVKQVSEGVNQVMTGLEEDPDILAVDRKLDTMKIDLAFDNARLEDILDFIRDFSGLNIVLDSALQDRADPSKTLTFRVKDLVLKSVLKLLLSQFGLEHTVTRKGVVLLTTPDKAPRETVLELHDFRKVLAKYAGYEGARSVTAPALQEGQVANCAVFALSTAGASFDVSNTIMELIKSNVAPGTWVDDRSIEATPNQQLLINHIPIVHLDVHSFIDALNSFDPDLWESGKRFRLQESIRKLGAGDKKGRIEAQSELDRAGPVAVVALADAIERLSAAGSHEQGSKIVEQAHREGRLKWVKTTEDFLDRLDDDDAAIRCDASAHLTLLARSARSFIEPLIRNRLESAERKKDMEVLCRCRSILEAIEIIQPSDLVEFWRDRRGMRSE